MSTSQTEEAAPKKGGMHWAFKVLVGLGVFLTLFCLVAATRPATFHIERSITIAAPPAAAFDLVNDFHGWSAWSPWEKLDPNLQRTFEGPSSGVGAHYAWAGNEKVGEGRMTIEKSEPSSRIVVKIEFLKPWTATNIATFTFVPDGAGTKVVWAMDGHNDLGAKMVTMFMDMDKLVGGDFERGLAQLKAVAEKR